MTHSRVPLVATWQPTPTARAPTVIAATCFLHHMKHTEKAQTGMREGPAMKGVSPSRGGLRTVHCPVERVHEARGRVQAQAKRCTHNKIRPLISPSLKGRSYTSRHRMLLSSIVHWHFRHTSVCHHAIESQLEVSQCACPDGADVRLQSRQMCQELGRHAQVYLHSRL